MVRALALAVVAVFVLAACSGGERSGAGTADRCEQAKSSEKSAQKFASDLSKQDSKYDEANLFKHLATGKASDVEVGVADMRQLAYQMVSDNPACFSVTRVSESRRALKLLDPLILESLRQHG